MHCLFQGSTGSGAADAEASHYTDVFSPDCDVGDSNVLGRFFANFNYCSHLALWYCACSRFRDSSLCVAVEAPCCCFLAFVTLHGTYQGHDSDGAQGSQGPSSCLLVSTSSQWLLLEELRRPFFSK